MSLVFYGLGLIAAAISAWFCYAGFQIETAIATPEAPAGFEGVANLQMMHFQQINFEIGIGAAIVAAILLAAGGLADALQRPNPPSE